MKDQKDGYYAATTKFKQQFSFQVEEFGILHCPTVPIVFSSILYLAIRCCSCSE